MNAILAVSLGDVHTCNLINKKIIDKKIVNKGLCKQTFFTIFFALLNNVVEVVKKGRSVNEFKR